MAGANPKTNAAEAAKIERLEMELKNSFKEGKFETVRKKVDDLRKLDPENRLAARILEKVQVEEAEGLKRSNAIKIKGLEAKMGQAFKAGDLPGMDRLMEEVKKLDPKNRKVVGYEATFAKAKQALEGEMKREKAQKLSAEIEFFVNKADWAGAQSKANELLALEWNHPAALRAIEKVAKAKRVKAETLITAKSQKVEQRPGLLSGFFAKRSEVAEASKAAVLKTVAKPAVAEAVKPVTPMAAAKPVAIELKPAAKPVVREGGKAEPAKVESKSVKTGLFSSLFARKPEVAKPKEAPKAPILKAVAKPILSEAVKPVLVEIKPTSPVVTATRPVTVDLKAAAKPGLLAHWFARKPEVAKPKEAPKAPILKAVAKPILSEAVKPVLVEIKPASPAVATAKPVVAESKPDAKPAVQEMKKAEPAKATPAKVESKSVKPGFFSGLFAKRPGVAKPKEAPKAMVSAPSAKTIVQEIKKGEPAKALPAFGLLATMLDTKPVASPKAAPVPPAPMRPEVPILKPIVAPAVAPKPMAGVRPQAPAMAPAKPKASIFGSLFAKKEEPKKAVEVPVAKANPAAPSVVPAVQMAKVVEAPAPAPVAMPAVPMAPKPELKPVLPTPLPQKASETQLRLEQKTVAKPETNTIEKGNIFTSLFGKEEEAGPSQKPSASVLETIVAKTSPEKAESKAKREKAPEENTGEGLLAFASVFLKFAVVFVLVSAAFLYVENMDTGNTVLGIFKTENNAIQLHNADNLLADQQAAEDKINKDIGKYKGGYQDESQKIIDSIIANRMDWPSLLGKLNEVTESVYAKNEISQYVQYNNFNYDAEKGQLTVTGTLSDPLGKNLTKLAELEQAFRNYPKDPSNPNDDRKPYFYGVVGFTTYSKAFNSATGRFQSTFNLSLSTMEPDKK